VRALFDTGPAAVEIDQIENLFAAIGMAVTAEGHSYGGPPPTSAFLIVINAPLAPFLDHFAALADGAPALAHIAERLLAMRADQHRWGRRHTVRLEDSHTDLTVTLPAGLPADAYLALLDVDLSGFDQASPPTILEWDERFRRWTGRLTTAPLRVVRRLPRRANGDPAGAARVRQLDDAEVGTLWRLVADGTGSVLTWQRARAVLLGAMGWSAASVARQTAMSAHRVRAVVTNFNRHGFRSLTPGYADGEPVEFDAAERAEVLRVGAQLPTVYHRSEEHWSAVSLAEFLVSEGVVEDADPYALGALTATTSDDPDSDRRDTTR
jgi:transposase